MIGALEQWVEHGKAPDQVIASHLTNNLVDRTRPLCPYPQVASYKGTGIPHAISCQLRLPGAVSIGMNGTSLDRPAESEYLRFPRTLRRARARGRHSVGARGRSAGLSRR